MAVTEALKAAGVGQTTPLASPTMVNPSPGCVDASATVETVRAAEIASISSMSALGRHGLKSRFTFLLISEGKHIGRGPGVRARPCWGLPQSVAIGVTCPHLFCS